MSVLTNDLRSRNFLYLNVSKEIRVETAETFQQGILYSVTELLFYDAIDTGGTRQKNAKLHYFTSVLVVLRVFGSSVIFSHNVLRASTVPDFPSAFWEKKKQKTKKLLVILKITELLLAL